MSPFEYQREEWIGVSVRGGDVEEKEEEVRVGEKEGDKR